MEEKQKALIAKPQETIFIIRFSSHPIPEIVLVFLKQLYR